MYRLKLVSVIFLVSFSSTATFIQGLDISEEKNTDEGYIFVIRATHTVKKRDVFGIDTLSQPNEETVVILSNPAMNYPYNTYGYGTNPGSRYGTNRGTTVVVNNPDSNYNSGYARNPYIPNKYG